MKNTTPYYNCPTKVLETKSNRIKELIEKINSIPGNYLNYIESGAIVEILLEMKDCLNNEIENRKENKQ